MTEETRRPGRPGKMGASKPLQVHLTLEQHEWLTSQDDSASFIVRQLVDDAMEGQTASEKRFEAEVERRVEKIREDLEKKFADELERRLEKLSQ